MRPYGATELSVAELGLLWDLLGLDPPDGLDRAGAPAAVTDVRARLASRGLLDGSGPAPPVAAALHRLVGAPLVLDLHRAERDPVRAVAALDAGRATLAVRRGQRVGLRDLPPDRAPSALLDLLGPLRPARGRPVHVPVRVLADALAAAGEDPRRLVVELMRRGMAGTAARMLVAANRDVDVRARIGAAVGTPAGPRPGPHRLLVQHNSGGHHVQRSCAGTDGTLESAPATPERIARGLDDLVRAAGTGPWEGPRQAGLGVVAGRVAYGTSSS